MTHVKRVLAGTVVLAIMLSVVLVIPSGAATSGGNMPDPGCYCDNDFLGTYHGGIVDGMGGNVQATAHVTHRCDGCYAYVSSKCWVYTSNYNNYTSRTYTASGRGTNSATADLSVNVQDYGFNLRAVENYYMVRVLCEGEEFTSQKWQSDGNVPLSVLPPVVTE